MKKRDLENKNTDLKKIQKQMSDNNNMEVAALKNIANSCETRQSLGKTISRTREKLTKSPRKRQVGIKALAKKSQNNSK